MCNPAKHIKLCTCGDQVPEDNYWELFRPSGSLYVVGDFVEPEAPQIIVTELLEAKFAADLNQHDCFDFEFTPEDGDILQLTVDGQDFTYLYKTGASAESDRAWRAGSWGLMPDNLVHRGRIQISTN